MCATMLWPRKPIKERVYLGLTVLQRVRVHSNRGGWYSSRQGTRAVTEHLRLVQTPSRECWLWMVWVFETSKLGPHGILPPTRPNLLLILLRQFHQLVTRHWDLSLWVGKHSNSNTHTWLTSIFFLMLKSFFNWIRLTHHWNPSCREADTGSWFVG